MSQQNRSCGLDFIGRPLMKLQAWRGIRHKISAFPPRRTKAPAVGTRSSLSRHEKRCSNWKVPALPRQYLFRDHGYVRSRGGSRQSDVARPIRNFRLRVVVEFFTAGSCCHICRQRVRRSMRHRIAAGFVELRVRRSAIPANKYRVQRIRRDRFTIPISRRRSQPESVSVKALLARACRRCWQTSHFALINSCSMCRPARRAAAHRTLAYRLACAQLARPA